MLAAQPSQRSSFMNIFPAPASPVRTHHHVAACLRVNALQAALVAGCALHGAPVLAQQSAADDASMATLPTVTVSGHREAIDEAPSASAGGQVGSGARLGILGNTAVMDTPLSVTSYTAETIENTQAAQWPT